MVKKKGEATGPEGKAGFSEFTWPDGAKYAGEWQDGKMHGKGTYVETDGARYEGEWDNGKMHGQGVQIFAKGDRYEGEYFNGQRHGKGKQAFANGNMYEGHFWQSQIHGKGTYTCADGRVYWGEFKNNKKHGDGKYSGANGTYTGQYAEGKKHGNGQFTWLDGSSYDGQWADDVMHGTGMKTEADGSRHQVVFEKGRQVNSLATLSSTMRAPGKSALPVPSPSTRESGTARKLGGAKQGPFRDDGMAGTLSPHTHYVLWHCTAGMAGCTLVAWLVLARAHALAMAWPHTTGMAGACPPPTSTHTLEGMAGTSLRTHATWHCWNLPLLASMCALWILDP